MTEETITHVSINGIPVPESKLFHNETHSHGNDAPVTVSEDNIAKVNVSAEERELEPYKKHYLQEKRKNVTLQGFRKGKAPETMVARLFKDEARQSAKDNVLYVKYMKLLQEHKLQPLSNPKIDHIYDENGKVFASLTVDVLQPVALGQYLGLEIETMPIRSIDDGVNKTFAEIKTAYPKLTPSEIPLEAGNVVIADFSVTDGEKELEKQTDFKINIGSKLYFQPFEDQLIGLKIGETKEFDVQFPETYHKEEFKNKEIHFNFTAKEIKTIGEYTNEELAKVLGYESVEKMTELLTTQMESKFKDDEHLFYENQILGQLLAAHQFKVPGQLIDAEVKKIRLERPDMPTAEAEAVAERFQKTDLILNSIYERHPEIQYTKEQFDVKIAELAARANDTIENTIRKLQEAGKLQTYINYLNNCKVIDFLIEMADKKDTVITTENNVIEEKKNG